VLETLYELASALSHPFVLPEFAFDSGITRELIQTSFPDLDDQTRAESGDRQEIGGSYGELSEREDHSSASVA